ncbi:MAG TPA: PfkB family carbohydrate kinase [bacterium]|nr:PfkB family carbohydrate kinase [bacterium]
MSILVVGSIALDTIQTPTGKRVDALGGSATYFSYAASFFSKVRMVGVVGSDFPKEHVRMLEKRGIDIQGLEIVDGKTFRWSGSYDGDLNKATTHRTDLNVFGAFKPKIPASYKATPYVFLANIDPDLQRDVLRQVRRPKLVIADTMNLWIDIKRDSLVQLLRDVDIMIMNDAEIAQLTGEHNIIRAARKVLSYGPSYIVVKKGSHGAVLIGKSEFFSAPAYPLAELHDPTGAGDTFAGGFVGYLASVKKADRLTLRRAVIYGSVVASYNVEDFSLERLKKTKKADIIKRLKEIKKMVSW